MTRAARKARDIPWRHTLGLSLAAAALLLVSYAFVPGWAGLGFSVAVALLYLIVLRILMVREYRRFPHGRP